MPIVEHSDLDSESEKVRKALIPGDVRRRTPNEELLANLGMSTNPRNDYASYEEGKLLHRFVACFDQKPEMNKNKGEQESPKPDDAFLKNLFGDEWEEE